MNETITTKRQAIMRVIDAGFTRHALIADYSEYMDPDSGSRGFL